jgi:hypothetical protein
MHFGLTPPRSNKIEFPPTAEGHFRRAVFYVGAAVAALCALTLALSVVLAVLWVFAKLLHLR